MKIDDNNGDIDNQDDLCQFNDQCRKVLYCIYWRLCAVMIAFIVFFQDKLVSLQILTPQLMKLKSPQHNGPLLSLQEISLVSLNLTNIDAIQQYCKDIKIIYLMNNNLTDDSLNSLTYIPTIQQLNLAVNQIQHIPNLKRLVNLKKLDLTYNNLNDLNNIITQLQQCKSLEEIVLIGNPICQIEYFDLMIIHFIPQLKYLNNQEITQQMRQQADTLKDKFNINQIVDIQSSQNNINSTITSIISNDYTTTQQFTQSQQLQSQQDKIQQKYKPIEFKHKQRGKGFKINNQLQEFNYTHHQFTLNIDDQQNLLILKFYIERDFDQDIINVDIEEDYLYLHYTINTDIYELQCKFDCHIIPNEVKILKCQGSEIFKILMKIKNPQRSENDFKLQNIKLDGSNTVNEYNKFNECSDKCGDDGKSSNEESCPELM